jgi:hypothetical protein
VRHQRLLHLLESPAARRVLAVTELRGDPREVGELLATWVGIHMEEVDALLVEARDKAAAIPDQRVLWSLFGELLLEFRALQAEVADLRKELRG